MQYKVVACDVLWDPRTAYDQRYMRSFVIEELFTASMADSMIGYENNESVFEFCFASESFEDFAYV